MSVYRSDPPVRLPTVGIAATLGGGVQAPYIPPSVRYAAAYIRDPYPIVRVRHDAKVSPIFDPSIDIVGPDLNVAVRVRADYPTVRLQQGIAAIVPLTVTQVSPMPISITATHRRDDTQTARYQSMLEPLAGLFTPAGAAFIFTGPDSDRMVPYARIQLPPTPIVFGQAPFAASPLGFVPYTAAKIDQRPFVAPVRLPLSTLAGVITPPDPFYVFIGSNPNSVQYTRPYNAPTVINYGAAPFQLAVAYVPFAVTQGYARQQDNRQSLLAKAMAAFGADSVPPSSIPQAAYVRPASTQQFSPVNVATLPMPSSIVPTVPLVGYSNAQRWEVVRLRTSTTDITNAVVPLVPPPLWMGYQQRQEYRRPDERARLIDALYRVIPFTPPQSQLPGYTYVVSAGEFEYIVGPGEFEYKV